MGINRFFNKLGFVCIVLVLFVDFRVVAASDPDSGAVQYHALLISVFQYTRGWPSLSVRESKVDQLADQLKKHNYHVSRIVNPDSVGLQNAIEKFTNEHTGSNNKLLFFYTGHSYRDQQGNSCLIPADTMLPSAKEGLSGREPISIINILDGLKKQKVNQVLFVVDGPISVYTPDVILLNDLAKSTKKVIAKDSSFFPLLVVGAGTAGEAALSDSHFIDIFTQALQQENLWEKDVISAISFCDFIQTEVGVNSWQTAWCKMSGDPAMLNSLVLFDRRSSQKLKDKNKSFLRVTSVPTSGTVRILNIRHKYTEGGIELPAGKYNVEVIAPPGYLNKTQWVKLLSDEDFEFTVNLTSRSSSEVKAFSSPEEIPKEVHTNTVPQVTETNALANIKKSSTSLVGDFRLVEVKKGSFVMGGERYNEGPVHSEKILSDFFIMDTEVSVQQYADYLNSTGGSSVNLLTAKDFDLPVVNVSWQEAMNYAQWLSNKTGQNYRLPTEAEWEYVARKGMFSELDSVGYPENIKKIVPVRMSWRNKLDIYGMPGNVWEWCLDCWSQRYENKEVGKSKDVGTCANKVIRGGSWRDSKKLISVTSRNGVASVTKANNIGFRLVMQK